MATCVLLGVEARLAKTDAMLLMTSVAAMGALGRIYLASQGKPLDSRSTWVLPAVLWTAVAGGILLKGPLILMFIGLAVATLAIADRDAKWLLRTRPITGLFWVLLLALPWFVAILLRSGETFFSDSVGQDLFAKVVSGQESHGAPPGSYFVMFWGTFWPGSILAGLAALPVWKARREPGARFLLAWLLPSWIVFEIVATKLPHYVLPLYPAVAILIAGVIDQHALLRRRWLEAGTAWWFIICAALALATILAHIVIGQQLGLLAWPFAAAAVIFALLAWRLYEVDGAELSLVRACIASVCVSFMVYGATFPALPTLFPAEELASEMRGVDCQDPMVATAGYHEPSLVLLTSTDLRHTDGAGAAEFLRPGGCRYAFVESRQERSFVQRADAIGLRYALEARVEGYNISGGRKISVAIFRAEGGQ
jgi:4-amino-4-deoxy-L-arabinose transferase-like glycosyltransferase